MNIDLYTFLHRFFDEHPKDVEVMFFDIPGGMNRGSMWVRRLGRLGGTFKFKSPNNDHFRNWTTLREGEYCVFGVQPPSLVGPTNYRIKISYIQKKVRF